MLHAWFYYYKGRKGRKKIFHGGTGYYEKDAIQALEDVKHWLSEDDDDGDMERLTGTPFFHCGAYITKDNSDGSSTVFFNKQNVIYHEDTKTGKFFQNEKILIELGALQILSVNPKIYQNKN